MNMTDMADSLPIIIMMNIVKSYEFVCVCVCVMIDSEYEDINCDSRLIVDEHQL